MNRIYKTRFNRRLGVWQAVPETARGGGKSTSCALAVAVFLGAVLAAPPSALAQNLLVGAGGAGGAGGMFGAGGGGGGIGGGGGGGGYESGGGGGGGVSRGSANSGELSGVDGGNGGGGGSAGGAGGAGGGSSDGPGGRGNVGGGGGGASHNYGDGGGGGAIGANGGSAGTSWESPHPYGGAGGDNGGGGGGGAFLAGAQDGAHGSYAPTTTEGPAYTPGTDATYDFVGVGGGGGGGGASGVGDGAGGSAGQAGSHGSNGTLTLDGVSLTVRRSLLVGGAGGGGGGGDPTTIGGSGGNGGSGTLVLQGGASLDVRETLVVGGSGGGPSNWVSFLQHNGGAGGHGSLTTASGTTVTVNGQMMVGGDGGGESAAGGTGSVLLGGDLVFGPGAAPLVIGGGSSFSIVGGAATSGQVTGLTSLVNHGTLHFDQAGTTWLDADISGTGTLHQNGSGTTILTGTNSYDGTTSINAGTLQIGAGGTTGSLGAGDVINNGTLAFNRDGTLLVTNIITGSGSVRQLGPGKVTLAANNTYAGTTTVSGGTLQVGNGGTLGSLGTGAVINNGELIFHRSDNFVVANEISGTGALTKQGNGWMTLTGNNSYAGTTTISAGTLQVGNGNTSGSLGTGAVINNGELIFRRSDNFVVANEISGTGALTKEGTDRMTLTGNNSYAGTTTISAGTLQVGNGGATGSLGGGDVINNGELVFNRTGTVTVANNISGSGGLTQRGANGVLELLGSNTYTGNTYITGGSELRVAAGALGGSLVEVDGGRLRALESMALAHDLVFFGGSNGLAVSDGQVLTVTGRTEISGPTTLTRFGGTGAMGAIRLEDELQMFASTLDVNGVTTHLANLQGFGTLTSNGGPAEVTVERGDFGGSIAGNIALTKAGSDLLILSERNTYTGATTIAGGVVRLRAEGAVADGTAVTLHGDSRLQLEGYDQSIGSLAGTSELSSVELDGATLTVGSNGTSTTYAGWIGSGALVKTGAGNLTLTGDFNDLTSTHVAAGTLTIGDGGTSGTLGDGGVTNDGTLAFNRADDVMVSHDITGTGVVRKLGAGMLELTGTNSYTGGTAIDAGTLSIFADHNIGAASGALSLQGGKLRTTAAFGMTRNVTLTGNGTFEVDGASLTLGGAVGGTGNLVKEGPGTLVLAADNSYAGTTTVSSGTLQVGNGGATGSLGAGAVTNNGQLTFDRGGDFTVTNAIGGTGAMTKLGSGTMTLTGTSSYTGTTIITAGTLQVGNGGTTGALGPGNVTNNGALAFNRSDTVSLANVIDGTGSLTQAGSGNLVLTGTNTYTGGTFVNAGTLSVNGSIAGNTMVNNGGALGGTGTVGNVTVASGGALAPGNSIGTLSVAGNLRFAPGSIYRVEANSAGAADRVNTVGAGTIAIDGGTVDVQAGGAGYQRNTRYTILSSGGATTGQFDDVTTNLAFLTPTLVYEGNAVLLNLQASNVADYSSVARTPNQAAVATYLGSFANAPTNAEAAALIQRIDNMTAEQAAASFGSMAGSAHAGASQVASALGRNFSASLAARSGFGTGGLGSAMNDWSRVHYASLAPVAMPQDDGAGRGFWVQALGAGGQLDTDGNADGSRYRSHGLVLGYDQPVTGRWLAGGAFGYSSSRWNATSGAPSSGKIESPQAGLYARYAGDTWRVRLDGTFARHDFSTDRGVSVAGTAGTARSKHAGREWAVAGQVEMPIRRGEWEMRPLAGLRHAHLSEDAFNETGTGPVNLAVAKRTTRNTLLSAGMHLVRQFNQGRGGLELRAVASHLAGDNDSPVTASIAGQAGSFTAAGVPLKRNALTLGATISGEFTRNVSAYLDANYEYRGSGQDAYRLTGGVRVAF